MSDEEAIKRRYREFLDLLPLTLSLAGLSPAEPQRNFTTEQMEFRAQVVVNAYKIAKQTARDSIKPE